MFRIVRRFAKMGNARVAAFRELSLSHIRKSVSVSLPLLAALLLQALPAVAACPQPDPKVCAEFFKSAAVFVGTVVSQRTVPPGGDFYDGWSYRLRVHRMFRGPGRRIIDVFTENSSARFPLEVGREYLLFARKSNGRLEIDCCGNSGQLSEVKDKIREIEQLAKASSGAILGRVAYQGLGTGVDKIRVVARGAGKTYTAVTDRDGWFRMTVRPGRYSVLVKSPDVSAYDLSYDDPSDFVVPRGGCAQLQFVAIRQ